MVCAFVCAYLCAYPKNHEMAHVEHFLAALGPAPALTAFGGAFSIDHNDGQVYRTMCD